VHVHGDRNRLSKPTAKLAWCWSSPASRTFFPAPTTSVLAALLIKPYRSCVPAFDTGIALGDRSRHRKATSGRYHTPTFVAPKSNVVEAVDPVSQRGRLRWPTSLCPSRNQRRQTTPGYDLLSRLHPLLHTQPERQLPSANRKVALSTQHWPASRPDAQAAAFADSRTSGKPQQRVTRSLSYFGVAVNFGALHRAHQIVERYLHRMLCSRRRRMTTSGDPVWGWQHPHLLGRAINRLHS
jgi:hypothetical protein